MDAKQFQLLASRLIEQGAYPAEYRSAISRSYYAVYHVGLELLNSMGFGIESNSTAHEQVYRHLNNSGDKDLVGVAAKLGDLRTKRIHADYRLDRLDVESKENAKLLVQSAERIIKTLKRYSQTKNRNLIIKNINDWKNKIDKALKKQPIEKH
jgi:uncharacterized protein (UPF0332 family)